MEALLIVDLQNDFMPWGPLPVKEGDRVVPIANKLMSLFPLVVASMDWHPSNHGSFASQYTGKKPFEEVMLGGLEQVLWPDHCVQNSDGAQFVSSLDTSMIHKVIYKGTDPQIDSYSAFFDNAHRRETGLNQFLQEKNVTDLCILGLATDYCVKFSVLDALKLGYRVKVLIDGCRGVEINPGDGQKSVDEMKKAGAIVMHSKDLFGSRP